MVLLLYLVVSCVVDFLGINKILSPKNEIILYSFFTVFEVSIIALYFQLIIPKVKSGLVLLIILIFFTAESIFYFNSNLTKYDFLIVAVEYMVLLIFSLIFFYSKATSQPPTPNLWQGNRVWAVLAIFIYVTSGFLYFAFFNNIDIKELEKTGLINLPAIAVILRNIVFSISFLKKQP